MTKGLAKLCRMAVRLGVLVVIAPVVLCSDASSQVLNRSQRLESLTIGGYSVAVGMPVAAVNSSLGSVFRPQLVGSDQYVYLQGEDAVAKVFLKNGKVDQVIKYFGIPREGEGNPERHLRAMEEASAEFAQLTAGYTCSASEPVPKSSRSSFREASIRQYCGPFMLKISVAIYPHGNGIFVAPAIFLIGE